MVGKVKVKQRVIHSADAGVTKHKDATDAARNIVKRLRKGMDLKPLGTEVDSLVQRSPSAITLLCQAKVKLALAIEGLMKSGVLEFNSNNLRQNIEQNEKTHLDAATTATKQGVELHQSLLCARFYYKLMEVMQPGFKKLELAYNQMADPGAELLEQVVRVVICLSSVCGLSLTRRLLLQSNLCDFETWEKAKDKSDLKVKLIVELERIRQSSLDKRKPNPNSFDIAEGIFHSGLLYDTQRGHLGSVLTRRQNKQQQAQQLQDRQHQRQQSQLLQASLQASPTLHLSADHAAKLAS